MHVSTDAMMVAPEPRKQVVLPGAGKGSPRPLYRPGVYDPFKRIIDLGGALFLGLVTFPLVLFALILVRLTSRGPVIYSQTRLGRGGRPYTIYKIRSMTVHAEKGTGAQWAKPDDPRVTPIGRILRKTHIDELPQLWNVLRGDMSLIGPRPERPEFVEKLEKVIPYYRERLAVRPGITGLAQLQLPPDSDLEGVRRKLAHDLYYTREYGPWIDVQITLGTIFYVFRMAVYGMVAIFRMPGGAKVEKAYEDLVASGEISLESAAAWRVDAPEHHKMTDTIADTPQAHNETIEEGIALDVKS